MLYEVITVDTIDEHVEHVRALFLKTLGQDKDGHVVRQISRSESGAK